MKRTNASRAKSLASHNRPNSVADRHDEGASYGDAITAETQHARAEVAWALFIPQLGCRTLLIKIRKPFSSSPPARVSATRRSRPSLELASLRLDVREPISSSRLCSSTFASLSRARVSDLGHPTSGAVCNIPTSGAVCGEPTSGAVCGNARRAHDGRPPDRHRR